VAGILEYGFMQNAFLAALLVSVACGLVGTYVVIKRIVFISGGISHAAFGGIGLGYFLGVNPILAAIPFSILSALIMGVTSKKVKVSEDTAILTPGYAPDLLTYLFGSILTVPQSDLMIMFILDLTIVITVLLFRREFLSICFDDEFSKVLGMHTTFIYLLLLSLVALSVVVLIKVVGVILVIALLTIPAAIAKQYTYRLEMMMLLAVGLGMLLTTCGLYISYLLNLASGATIVLVLGLAFLLSALLKRGN
jgi:zinc transport system permease protein